MNIDFLILAKHYYKLGLNVTCITDTITENNFYDNNILKAPYHPWKHLKKERQTEEELLSYDWSNATGIGTIAGYNELTVIDIDGCTNFNFLKDVLHTLGLPSDYEWVVKTGSQAGFHIYFYYDRYYNKPDIAASTFPPNIENMHSFEKMEFLWNTHVVLPNSLHKSSYRYSFLNCNYPQNKPATIYTDINKDVLLLLIGKYLNRPEMIKKKIYFDTPLLNQPSNLETVRLNEIEKQLYFLFDIETDGLIEGNSFPNIVQIAWLIMDAEGIVYKRQVELINCEFDSKSEAMKINQLNVDVIRKIGVEPKFVLKNLMIDIRYCCYIVSHNIEFDYPILLNEFKKNNFLFDDSNKKLLCTMRLGHALMNNLKYPKLTELYEYLFGHKINQLHNADADVLILSKCLRELFLREIRNKKGNLSEQ